MGRRLTGENFTLSLGARTSQFVIFQSFKRPSCLVPPQPGVTILRAGARCGTFWAVEAGAFPAGGGL